jgi:hypothetical protein
LGIAYYPAVRQPVPKPLNGQIVVNADEWTLSNQSFQKAPDTATFVTNVAQYFVGDKKGKFHVLSNNFGLTQSSLEQTMTKAGHTWTKGMNIPIDLATLSQYDAVFVGGDPVNNQVLIDYVKNGKFADAANKIPSFNSDKPGFSGLKVRREKEKQMFCKEGGCKS